MFTRPVGDSKLLLAVRESYTASYHLVRLHVCAQRVHQRKTEETSVPRGPLEGLLERLRCHRLAGLGTQSPEDSCHGGRDRRWADVDQEHLVMSDQELFCSPDEHMEQCAAAEPGLLAHSVTTPRALRWVK